MSIAPPLWCAGPVHALSAFCLCRLCSQTSLVARPPISFDLCKERLFKRLEHHGIEVTKVMDEEELCYIPMGGAMPSLTQVSCLAGI